jgi:hypothetical protein
MGARKVENMLSGFKKAYQDSTRKSGMIDRRPSQLETAAERLQKLSNPNRS